MSNTERTYTTAIAFASKELSALDKVRLKDTKKCIRLDVATANESITICPAYYVELDIHNEKSEDKDYKNFIIVDTEGNRYVTGSQSFMNAFKDIFDEISELVNDGEAIEMEIYQLPSKNYSGKKFLSCSLK